VARFPFHQGTAEKLPDEYAAVVQSIDAVRIGHLSGMIDCDRHLAFTRDAIDATEGLGRFRLFTF
jgi:hypothetical protein